MTSIRVPVLLVLASCLGCASPNRSSEAEHKIAELERENADLREQNQILRQRLDRVARMDRLVPSCILLCQPAIDGVMSST